MLMAGLDGVANKIDPGDPLDKNIYDLPPEEAAKVRQPASLAAGIPVSSGERSRLPHVRGMNVATLLCRRATFLHTYL